jgi:Transglutaminase-like superfamily
MTSPSHDGNLLNSKLYCLDSGRMLRVRAEELSALNLAAKTFKIKKDSQLGEASGRLFFFVREAPGNRRALHLELNGQEIACLPPDPQQQGGWDWAELPIPEGALCSGENRFVFRAEGNAPDSWSLAVSCEKPRGASSRSVDGGVSWPKNMLLGYDCSLTGEYIVRLEVSPDNNPGRSRRPAFVYEDPDNPRLTAMRQEFGLEKLIRGAGNTLERAGKIMSWWTGSWTYNGSRSFKYAPWDPFAVHAWKNAPDLPGAEAPLAFCVHSASCLTLLLRAIGLWARPVVTDCINPQGTGGHFLTELWSAEDQRWVVLDPHFDAVLTLDGEPAGALELQAVSERNESSRMGFIPGESYGSNPRCKEKWLQRWLANQGLWELGYWERGDMASHPELIPTEHGVTAYRSSDFLWLDTEKTPHRPYFPKWTRQRKLLNAAPAEA